MCTLYTVMLSFSLILMLLEVFIMVSGEMNINFLKKITYVCVGFCLFVSMTYAEPLPQNVMDNIKDALDIEKRINIETIFHGQPYTIDIGDDQAMNSGKTKSNAEIFVILHANHPDIISGSGKTLNVMYWSEYVKTYSSGKLSYWVYPIVICRNQTGRLSFLQHYRLRVILKPAKTKKATKIKQSSGLSNGNNAKVNHKKVKKKKYNRKAKNNRENADDVPCMF